MAKGKKFYLALNSGANSFTCPNTLFHVSGKEIKEVGANLKNEFFIKRALRSGHLKEVSEAEYLKFKEVDDAKKKINKKNASKQEYIDQLKSKLTEAVEENNKLKKRNEFLEKENLELKGEIENLKSDDGEGDDDPMDFDSMTVKDIKEYLNETYELSAEEVTKMDTLKKADLVDFANEIVAEGGE